jgi:hypothetical protein
MVRMDKPIVSVFFEIINIFNVYTCATFYLFRQQACLNLLLK